MGICYKYGLFNRNKIHCDRLKEERANYRNRTDDLHITRVLLYQLS
jgi:hypothetical protein